jgi:hypothetical protein
VDPVTECPACLGVARGGRIRVTEDTSGLLLVLLRAERGATLRSRRIFIETAAIEEAALLNEHLKTIDLVIDELKRTQTEMGWRHGEPQRQDA